MLRRSILFLSALALVITAIPASSQTTCNFTNVVVSGSSGPLRTFPSGVNKYGTVVGSFVDATGVVRAFRWSHGSVTRYLFPGSTLTRFYGNNDLGDMVGVYRTGDNRYHGLVRSAGNYINFDFPGAYDTFAHGINKYGTIVGYCTNADKVATGFIKRWGWTLLRYPNALQTSALAISDTGEIVGSYVDTNGLIHGFTYKSGVYTTVDYPGALTTNVYGVNKYGSLVGFYKDDTTSYAWQRKGGVFKTIAYPGTDGKGEYLSGISNLGDEVGYGVPAPFPGGGFLRVCR